MHRLLHQELELVVHRQQELLRVQELPQVQELVQQQVLELRRLRFQLALR